MKCIEIHCSQSSALSLVRQQILSHFGPYEFEGKELEVEHTLFEEESDLQGMQGLQ